MPMPTPGRPIVVVRELRSVLLVAVGVAVVFTMAAAAFNQFHQVAAEDLNGHEVAATMGPGATQVLEPGGWGVALKLPEGKGLPALVWVNEGSQSVGLSATALESEGSACVARDNALGALLRLPAGAFAGYPKSGQTEVFLASLNGHDYVYEMPKTACADSDSAANLTAQAEAAIEGAGVLTAIGQ